LLHCNIIEYIITVVFCVPKHDSLGNSQDWVHLPQGPAVGPCELL